MTDTPGDPYPHRGHGRDYAAAIYGSIVATALIAALEEAHVSSRDVTLSVLATMVVFWVAHTWAAVAGERIHMRHRLSWHRVRVLATEEWPMVEAGFGPLAALGLGWVGLLDDGTAAKIAVAIGVVQLFAWGFVLGHRVYHNWSGAVLAGLGNGVLGLVLVLLEMAVLH
jgi:hypothetical protein